MTTPVDLNEVAIGIVERGEDYVSECTGFDLGDQFESEAQVREYFRVEEIEGKYDDGCPYTQEALDLMADAVIEHGWHMAQPVTAAQVRDWMTTYTDRNGAEHVAIQVPWEDANRIVGHETDGSVEDSEAIDAALLAAGAPDWVRTAEGWTDEEGWGLIGPAL